MKLSIPHSPEFTLTINVNFVQLMQITVSKIQLSIINLIREETVPGHYPVKYFPTLYIVNDMLAFSFIHLNCLADINMQ